MCQCRDPLDRISDGLGPNVDCFKTKIKKSFVQKKKCGFVSKWYLKEVVLYQRRDWLVRILVGIVPEVR